MYHWSVFEIAFCKMCAIACGNDFSNTLWRYLALSGRR